MPQLIAEPEQPPVAKLSYGRRPLLRRVVGVALRLVVLALVLALALGGWYLAKKGFGRQWRYKLVEELHKRGVEASVRRLTLDPFRGLVARDVRIFDYKNRENTLALISEVSFDINYAALLHRQSFLNAIDVHDAQLLFPLRPDDPKGPKAELTKFHAHIYFPPEQIYVSQAEGVFCGVRISATGQLIKRENYAPSAQISDAEWQQRLEIFQRVVTELGRFTFPGAAPRLQIKFSGDLSQLEDARLEARLQGDRIQRGLYEMKNLVTTAEWIGQKLSITQCEWSDDAGSFAGRASWSRQTGVAEFQARSTLNLKSFFDAFRFEHLLADTTFNAPPLIEISGTFPLGETDSAKSVIGRAALRDFTYKAVPFTGLNADFSWDGERTMVRDLRLQQGNGDLTADLLDAPNDFRLNVDSTINPTALRPLVPVDFHQFASEWEWPRSPAIHLVIRGPSHSPDTWTGDGTVAMQRTRFRGVWMNSASANLHFGNGAMTYENFRVTRDEGVGTGSFTYDFAKHEVRVANVKTALRPAEVIYWIDPKLAKPVAPYKFRQPPNLTTNGVVQFHGGKNTHLEITVDGAKGMDYVFLGKTLPFDRVSGRLLFTDDRLQLNDVLGRLFSGLVRGGADISLAKNDLHYRANLAAEGIDFPLLTDLYFKYQTAQGRMGGSYDFTGLGDNPRTMRGSGKIQVTNGDVFAIPIFGPLSQLIAHIIPSVGYSVAHNATTSFTIKDGVAHTDAFHVAGKLFGMIGHGDIHFLDDRLDFDVRINANGAGLVLLPMYKLFEYKGEGSLNHPDWHPKRF
ncbi:MAG: AsmA-like C-terminal region-containing protein [Verrucomicrobiota bacterium]|nr:AsmA-like C-terminal region-containing protein [Verrucomicrobiota bacterium]